MKNMDLSAAQEHEAAHFQRKLYNTNPIPSMMWSMSTMKIIGCNVSATELVGAQSSHDYITNFSKYQPKYQPCGTLSEVKITELFSQTLKYGTLNNVPWVQRHVNGELIPGNATLKRVEFRDEPMITAYFQDIRKLRDTDEKIYESMQMTQILLDTSPTLVEIWDSKLTFVDCNKRTLEFFGVSTKEEYEKRYYEFMPKTQPCGTFSVEYVMRNTKITLEKGKHRFELERKNPFGEVLNMEVLQFNLDIGGKNLLISYNNDLSSMKAAIKMESERNLNERIRMVFNAAPMLIEYWNKDYDVLDCNQTVLDFYGYTSKEEYRAQIFRNSPLFQLNEIPTRAYWNENLEKIFQEGSASFEYTDRVNNETVYISVQGVRMNYSGETIAITYANDVTQVKKMEDERRRKEIAEESNRTKSIFLARMSHEIRTPISSVIGISEIQLQNPGLAPNVQEAFSKIFYSAEMLLNLINEILDLSKIEAGKMTLNIEEYKTTDVINDIAQIAFSFMGKKGIRFNLNIDETLPVTLTGDFIRVKQVLANLLTNAFKYTEAGEVEVSIKKEELAPSSLNLVCVISDTGYGMTEEQLEKISTDYSRFHKFEKRYISGVGLGIPIVFNLLNLMNGSIKYESEVGKGTTVVVKIPQESPKNSMLGKEAVVTFQTLDASADASKFTQRFIPEPMPYGKVLVVDDVESNLYVAKGLLKFYDLQIETCESGIDAVNKVKSGKVYDIIFMDYMMPDLNGIEAMFILRKIGYKHPIIALTADAMQGQAENFIKKGFDAFISKPIQTKHLNEVLVKFIKDKQSLEIIEEAEINSENDINSFMESDDVLSKLKSDFVKGQKNSIKNIKKAILDEDYISARRFAHNLKSTSALINEGNLSQIAALAENELSESRPLSEDLLQKIQAELEICLSQIALEPQVIPSGIIDKEKVRSIFEALMPLLASRSVTSLEHIEELRTIPETAVLTHLIENFDFSAAEKVLEILQTVLDVG